MVAWHAHHPAWRPPHPIYRVCTPCRRCQIPCIMGSHRLMSIILHPLQHGPEERYADGSHPGGMHTLQMACSALHTHDVWVVAWVWPYPAPLHLVSPLPNWYHGTLHPLDGMLHPGIRAPIQVLHTLSAWCTPRHQVCRQALYGMP